MDDAIWIVPISTVPGLGLLVLSTSARYMTVALQLRERQKEHSPNLRLTELIYRRARCLQRALWCLYVSIASFVVASLMGAIASQWDKGLPVSAACMFVGGFLALYAVGHLVYEAFTSSKIVEHDFRILVKLAESRQ